MPLCLRVGSLLLMAAMCAGCSAEPPPRARGIVLITLDTTRADHLGVYGHAGGVSPSTDALAAESEVFEHAISPSSWTLPAHASLFTGKLPTAHGAEYAKNGPLLLAAALPDEDLGEYRARGLDRGEVTLAERLRQAGYATHAVVAGPWLKRVFGLDAGFATYDDQGINHVNGRPANEVTDAAIAWLRQQASQPFFLFLNYYDAHAPYLPPPAAKERFFDPLPAAAKQDSMQAANALYDAEIWFADQHVGRLFAFLKETGRWDDTLIVVTADHGDLLGEHGRFGHGRSVTQAEIHVPLIIKQPRSRARVGRVSAPVQLTDVFAALLDSAGLSVPDDIQGQALTAVTHPIVAEVYPLEFASDLGDFRCLIEMPFKYVWNSKGRHQLFDLRADPHELEDRLGDDRERARRMGAKLAAYLGSLDRSFKDDPERAIDEETRRALEALGYLDAAKKAKRGGR